MPCKLGDYRGGIRTLEDLRIRCRMDDCGCWIWGMGVGSGKPSVILKIDGKHKSMGGRRAAYILAGGPELSSKTVVRQSDKCPNKLCVNPAHGVLGTHSQAWIAAQKRDGWRRPEHGQAAGKRLKMLMAKLSDEKAAAIRASDEPIKVLAERYGVSGSAISLVLSGKTWVSPASVNSIFSQAKHAA